MTIKNDNKNYIRDNTSFGCVRMCFQHAHISFKIFACHFHTTYMETVIYRIRNTCIDLSHSLKVEWGVNKNSEITTHSSSMLQTSWKNFTQAAPRLFLEPINGGSCHLLLLLADLWHAHVNRSLQAARPPSPTKVCKTRVLTKLSRHGSCKRGKMYILGELFL